MKDVFENITQQIGTYWINTSVQIFMKNGRKKYVKYVQPNKINQSLDKTKNFDKCFRCSIENNNDKWIKRPKKFYFIIK